MFIELFLCARYCPNQRHDGHQSERLGQKAVTKLFYSFDKHLLNNCTLGTVLGSGS